MTMLSTRNNILYSVIARICAVALGVGVVAGCAGEPRQIAAPLEATADVIEAAEAATSLGFTVEDDGWPFQNYEAGGQAQFSISDAIALFGDSSVCVENLGDCTPTPAASEWVAMVAASMAGGVCEGLTVSSLDRFLVSASPSTGSVGRTTEIERHVARLFATQFLQDVIDATTSWRERSVSEIVVELQTALADGQHEQYTLGLYTQEGGHSVVPYAIDLDPDGHGIIHVYDSNWPGRDRYIEVDTSTNRWRFSYFSPDQADDPDAWTGGNGTMDLTPLSTRETPFPEPFSGAGSGSGLMLAITATDRNWTITDAEGNTTSGKNLIPGQGGIVATIRGAFGATTTLVRVATDSVKIEAPSNTRVANQTRRGIVSVDAKSVVSVEINVEDDRLTVELSTGAEATVSLATGNERITTETTRDLVTRVVADDTTNVVNFINESGETVQKVQIERSDDRSEIVVKDSGEVQHLVPEAVPEESRVTKVVTLLSTEAKTSAPESTKPEPLEATERRNSDGTEPPARTTEPPARGRD